MERLRNPVRGDLFIAPGRVFPFVLQRRGGLSAWVRAEIPAAAGVTAAVQARTREPATGVTTYMQFDPSLPSGVVEAGQ